MTADRASSHSRVSWASMSFAAAPGTGSGMAAMVVSWAVLTWREVSHIARWFSNGAIQFHDAGFLDAARQTGRTAPARVGGATDNRHHATTPHASSIGTRDVPTAASAVRTLVAPAVARAAGPLRDARAAGVGAAVPGRHHCGLLVPAERGVRARAGVGEARHRDRAAADPPAAHREPGAARAHRARGGHPCDRPGRV